MPGKYYGFAFCRKEVEGNRAFLIAEPEKVVADRVLREKGRFSIRSMRQFLFDNLRIDPMEFRNLDNAIINEASRLSGRHALEILCNVRNEMS